MTPEKLTPVTAECQQALTRDLLDQLVERNEQRKQLELSLEQDQASIRAQFVARMDQIAADVERQSETIGATFDAQRLSLEAEHQRELTRIAEEHDEETATAQKQEKLQKSDGEYDWFLGKQRLQKEFESDQRELRDNYRAHKTKLKQHGVRFRQLVDQARAVLARHRLELRVQGGDLLEDPDDSDHLRQHLDAAAQVQTLMQRFQRTFWVRFAEERWSLIVFLVAAVVSLYPLYLATSSFVTAGLFTLALAAGVALTCGLLARSWAAQIGLQYRDSFVSAIVAGKQELLAAQAQNKRRRDARLKRRRQQRDQAANELDVQWQATVRDLQNRRQRRELELDTWAQRRRQALEQQFATQRRTLENHFQPQLDQLQNHRKLTGEELARNEEAALTARAEQHETQLARLAEKWQIGLHRLQEHVSVMHERCGASRWDLIHGDLDSWTPPRVACEAAQFGTLSWNLAAQPGAREDARFAVPVEPIRFPMAVDLYAQRPSVMIETHRGGKANATAALRSAMLRLMTSVPPGKLRFTIIDPVGLGESFSAFMHLADHDEQLINHRIWTEPPQIQTRLSELTKHMENVIQTYLRNEFESIQAYNEHAGEVAEAFRVLVVANFPNGFTEEAATRLLSIVSSGPRCGVYTLLSFDPQASLPRHLDLDELRQHTQQWVAEPGGLRLAAGPLSAEIVELDSTPDEPRTNAVLHAIGRRAKAADRVEVPFAQVAPSAEDWWTGDCRSDLSVPLGRAGATKLQSMQLGHGTSQHVLISGKTGSGKSTLLHAMITNLALKYSPDEVQFYLIDFKKGVEFKAYAEHALPHARVIAIESEREFGQSVLQRLDAELKRRGDLFRRARVQSLAGYRDARPEEAMPRILLVIDEFQEFFVKEDRIAQDASLLLDRLVRQGRAFGIHVLLGSQTLAGAYSLARATIGQMAVRIALQCSASDAHLILSDDNDAARLLRRPGEAIYNDANGLVEGNHPFQVVWLGDVEREAYLAELAERPLGRELPAPIVFEGNVAADLSRNEQLQNAWHTPPPAEVPRAPRAWLGEAIAIKEAPAVVFHRRSGSNLMIVGQQEESALGIMASSLLSLAAFSPRQADKRSRFVVLDGARPESNEAGYWNRLSETTDLQVEIVKPREADTVLGQIYEQVCARQASNDDEGAAIFLMIYNLSRFPSLRKSEDDFGLGRFGEESSTSVAQQIATILRDGPGRGVHTLMWSETHTNLMRWLDRQSLRDIEARVLFQMSATDSSSLMDSSAASQLGPHRAIWYSEDQGVAERFRPYGVPADELLLRIRACDVDPSRSAETWR